MRIPGRGEVDALHGKHFLDEIDAAFVETLGGNMLPISDQRAVVACLNWLTPTRRFSRPISPGDAQLTRPATSPGARMFRPHKIT